MESEDIEAINSLLEGTLHDENHTVSLSTARHPCALFTATCVRLLMVVSDDIHSLNALHTEIVSKMEAIEATFVQFQADANAHLAGLQEDALVYDI